VYITQADTSLSSCPCLLSPLRGSVGVLAHAGPCCARHTFSGLATLCRMPRPAVRVDDRPILNIQITSRRVARAKLAGWRRPTYSTRSDRVMRSHERQRAFLVPAAASPVSPSNLCCTDDSRRAMQRSFTSSESANASISTRLSLLSTTPVRNPMIRRHSLSCKPTTKTFSFFYQPPRVGRLIMYLDGCVCLCVCLSLCVFVFWGTWKGNKGLNNTIY